MTRLQIAPDLSLDIAEQGDGPLVILIAGGMMDMDQWALVADALSDAYRVVRYDQRGIGESDQPTEGYTVDQFAEDAVNLIIQPGGSVNDAEVTAAADERDIAMFFTGERQFRH